MLEFRVGGQWRNLGKWWSGAFGGGWGEMGHGSGRMGRFLAMFRGGAGVGWVMWVGFLCDCLLYFFFCVVFVLLVVIFVVFWDLGRLRVGVCGCGFRFSFSFKVGTKI